MIVNVYHILNMSFISKQMLNNLNCCLYLLYYYKHKNSNK